ncbi:response regulator transcription factor [Mycolicibacterium sp. XJ1819]
MNAVDRRRTVQTRVDAAGIGWLTAHPDHRGDPRTTQGDLLDALFALLDDADIRTIIVVGLPLTTLNGSPAEDASPADTVFAERFRQFSEKLWASGKTLVIRRNVEGAPGTTPDSPAYTEPLTERELQVLSLTCRGTSAREIGDRLFISERTVESHVSNAYRKLGIRSRVDLVRRAVQFGF